MMPSIQPLKLYNLRLTTQRSRDFEIWRWCLPQQTKGFPVTTPLWLKLHSCLHVIIVKVYEPADLGVMFKWVFQRSYSLHWILGVNLKWDLYMCYVVLKDFLRNKNWLELFSVKKMKSIALLVLENMSSCL